MRRKLWSEISDLSPVDREFGMQSSLMSCSFSPLLFPLSVWIFLKIVGMTSGICLYPVPWVLSKNIWHFIFGGVFFAYMKTHM